MRKYLTFTRLGKYGRIGNQLWEIAALISLAKKSNRFPAIPTNFEWRDRLNIPYEYYRDVVPDRTVQETQYHYIPGFLDGTENCNIVDICGTFQDTRYWEDMQEEIYQMLRPKDAGDFGKWSVGVHIRKGDYTNNKAYVQYDIDYYKSAIRKYFSDPRYQFFVLSDDYKYIEQHFEHSDKYILAYRSSYEDFCNMASCQPTGTKVRTPDKGDVNIESLKNGDYVMAYSSVLGYECIIGRDKTLRGAPPGRKISNYGCRLYSGDLVCVDNGSNLSKYTPDHICQVQLGNVFKEKHLLYLMRQGDKFRIGITTPNKYNYQRVRIDTKGYTDVRKRFSASKAGCCWILAAFDNRYEARIEEDFASFKFGIPQIQFFCRTKKEMSRINDFWDRFGECNMDNIFDCLRFYGRDINFPFLHKGNKQKMLDHIKPIDMRACNVMSGMNMIDADLFMSLGGKGVIKETWRPVNVSREKYDGLVYSFDVDINHTYIGDGIVTHNCANHILSGSSFSFWGAFLSPQGGKHIRVPRTHAGHLSHLDETHSYMPDWIINNDSQMVALMCYSDNNYAKLQQRLLNLNETSKQFDKVFTYTREDLEKTAFYKSHQETLKQERGGGYWLWKPYYILETLKQLQDGDILLYLDSGDMFFGDIRKFLITELTDRHIILTESGNIQKDYTKRDCFIDMDCDGEEYWNTKQVEAGVIAMKNSAKTRYIIKSWLDWCCNTHILDDSPNVKGEDFDSFVAHRHDQAILTNLKVLNNIYTSPAIREYVVCNVEGKDGSKVDLMDTTFIIPVSYDSEDRRENLEIVLAWIKKHFNTNVIVGECLSDHKFQYVEQLGVQYVYFDYDSFHRTKMLNEMTLMAHTNIVVNHDADVLLCVNAVNEAIALLRQGNSFVYPYNGAFLRLGRQYIPALKNILDIESFIQINGLKGWGDQSVGGSVAFLKDKYLAIGGENTRFVSHSPEDRCRAKRFSMFGGYKRVNYPLIHLDHWCGNNSCHQNEHVVLNNSEWRRIHSIKTPEDMMEYIKTWPYYKNV